MLGDNIRKIRRSKKLSINALSKITGISLGYLSDLENNKASNPTMEKLQKIADALNVPVDEFFKTEKIESEPDTKEIDFINKAEEKYGYRGKKQAKELLDEMEALFSGGELPEEDKDEFFRMMTEIYFKAKESNKKYGRRKKQ
jgi:transcriptional regulator with XRE-family HTH domain